MITVCNEAHAGHCGQREMFRGTWVPCFEVPGRLDAVVDALRHRGLGRIEGPAPIDDALLGRVHASRYIDFLRHAWDEWVALDPANALRDAVPSYWPVRGFRSDVLPDNFAARLGLFSFDAGTPLTAGTWAAARGGAACALTATRHVLEGTRAAFALTRPPGHHAGHDFFGGYCFVNNAALAAQALRDAGVPRVAILDVDYHHGNGTQALFYDRPDVLFVSVHGDPRTEYPFYLGHADEAGAGEGLGHNLNLPLPHGTAYGPWREALAQGLAAVASFRAEALVVSLGVDTFEADPICGFRLHSGDYLQVGDDLARAGLPTVFVFEGGYAIADVGLNTANVIDGFMQRAG